MYLILIYDIVEKGSSGESISAAFDESIIENTVAVKKRDNSRRIRKEVEKYLPRVQYSVYEGEIRPSDLKKLKAYLAKHAHKELDSIVLYEFEKPSYTKREVIGIDKLQGVFS